MTRTLGSACLKALFLLGEIHDETVAATCTHPEPAPKRSFLRRSEHARDGGEGRQGVREIILPVGRRFRLRFVLIVAMFLWRPTSCK